MSTETMSKSDPEAILVHLNEHGYAIIEGVLSADEVLRYRTATDALMVQERETPFDPGDGPGLPGDEVLEDYLKTSYTISDAERERLLRRIRHSRAQQQNTPWPVHPQQVNKAFLHLPTLFDHDRSQRIWNLVNKAPEFGTLIEHPVVLDIVQQILGADCVLADCSATRIGAHTGGGAWHVDVPLGQLPEPLPDFPLTVQNAWMLDDFTPENGATRVVPGSHLTRKKPHWTGEATQNETLLTGPAGSVAIWLSNTWHRSGPNGTDDPRRAILCYYCRSWVKPFGNFTESLDPAVAQNFSPQLRYLIGFSASAPVRG